MTVPLQHDHGQQLTIETRRLSAEKSAARVRGDVQQDFFSLDPGRPPAGLELWYRTTWRDPWDLATDGSRSTGTVELQHRTMEVGDKKLFLGTAFEHGCA
jgi:hypothetical protein